MPKPHRRVATMIALITTMLVAATPVSASAADDPGSQWPESFGRPAPCATAALSRVALDSMGGNFVVFGEATQCAPTVTDGAIAIAVYEPDSPRGISSISRGFPSSDPGAVVRFGVDAIGNAPRDLGVCVIVEGNRRVACALVTVLPHETHGHAATIEPLNPDDPLVAKDEITFGTPHQGFCGTCF